MHYDPEREKELGSEKSLASSFNSNDREADNSQTPEWIIRQIQDVANIEIAHDVCARKNSAKAKSYWTQKDDAFTQNWSKKFYDLNAHYEQVNAFYMNPPFSLQGKFQDKALEESKLGVVTMGCCSHSPDRDWFQKMEKTANYLFVPDGRIQFNKHDGTKFTRTDKKTGREVSTGAAFPVCFPLWLPYPNGGQVQIIRFKRDQKRYSL